MLQPFLAPQTERNIGDALESLRNRRHHQILHKLLVAHMLETRAQRYRSKYGGDKYAGNKYYEMRTSLDLNFKQGSL